ncbi:unnamed protein product [Rotaria magnacalcarata]|uniref:Uncharacterized protein n=2 Tax=Rotaria magnacalcarata TaxID=392030 RepID=A0A8S2IVW8_9BILA|nr:unnamed protein product [Rotaria magnacalcarata]CAF3787031.1 unnamed protein product [Rotaria magnacalcarata]
MLFSSDATKSTTKVRKMHRRYSHPIKREKQLSNIIRVSIVPSNNQILTKKNSSNHNASLSVSNAYANRSTGNLQQRNDSLKNNTNNNQSIRKNVSKTDSRPSSSSRVTPLKEIHCDDRFLFQVTRLESDRGDAIKVYQKNPWLVCCGVLPCLMAAIAVIIALPFLLIKPTTGVAQGR